MKNEEWRMIKVAAGSGTIRGSEPWRRADAGLSTDD
jgi:hypothetical protein